MVTVYKFCYLGRLIGAAGGAGDASRTRVRCGWKKFNEMAPILTLRGACHKLKGKIYNSCARSAVCGVTCAGISTGKQIEGGGCKLCVS